MRCCLDRRSFHSKLLDEQIYDIQLSSTFSPATCAMLGSGISESSSRTAANLIKSPASSKVTDRRLPGHADYTKTPDLCALGNAELALIFEFCYDDVSDLVLPLDPTPLQSKASSLFKQHQPNSLAVTCRHLYHFFCTEVVRTLSCDAENSTVTLSPDRLDHLLFRYPGTTALSFCTRLRVRGLRVRGLRENDEAELEKSKGAAVQDVIFGKSQDASCDKGHQNGMTRAGNAVDAESVLLLLSLCSKLTRLDLCLPSRESRTRFGRGAAAMFNVSELYTCLLSPVFNMTKRLRHLRLSSWSMERLANNSETAELSDSVYGVLSEFKGLDILELSMASEMNGLNIVFLGLLPNVSTLRLCGGVDGIVLKGNFGNKQTDLRHLGLHCVIVESVESLQSLLPATLESLQLSYISTSREFEEDAGTESDSDQNQSHDGYGLEEEVPWELANENRYEDDVDNEDIYMQIEHHQHDEELFIVPEQHLNLSSVTMLQSLSLTSTFVSWATISSAPRGLSELCVGGRASFGDSDRTESRMCAHDALRGMTNLRRVCLWEVGCGKATKEAIRAVKQK